MRIVLHLSAAILVVICATWAYRVNYATQEAMNRVADLRRVIAAEREAIQERARRERAESALRLFADRADVMPKEGWASDLAKANRDIPLWWFHAARVALEPPDTSGKA